MVTFYVLGHTDAGMLNMVAEAEASLPQPVQGAVREAEENRNGKRCSQAALSACVCSHRGAQEAVAHPGVGLAYN